MNPLADMNGFAEAMTRAYRSTAAKGLDGHEREDGDWLIISIARSACMLLAMELAGELFGRDDNGFSPLVVLAVKECPSGCQVEHTAGGIWCPTCGSALMISDIKKFTFDPDGGNIAQSGGS